MQQKDRRKKRAPGPALPAPSSSLRFLVRIAPSDVGMFRFLLEGYDNLAYFTVLDAGEALLSLVCSPHQEHEARACLEAVSTAVPLVCKPWPFAPAERRDAADPA